MRGPVVTARAPLSVTNGLGVHFSQGRDDWGTPPAFLAALAERWGPFDLDPCTDGAVNACAPRFYTRHVCSRAVSPIDGLGQPWDGRVFCNPPYSELRAWVGKAAAEAWGNPRCVRVVLLIPARTDVRAWHRHVWGAELVGLVEGRLRFAGAAQGAPFPSAVVVFGSAPSSPRFVPMDRRGGLGLHRVECAGCGEAFRAARSDARACSARCRMRIRRGR